MWEIIGQNYVITIVFILILIFIILLKHHLKITKMTEADRNFQKLDKSGTILEKGNIRSIYDFSLIPGLTKLVWIGTWPVVVVFVMMLILMGVYLYTKDSMIGDLFKVNLGAVLGAMFRMVERRLG